ncbi:protein of unknown function (DUF4350) [Frankia sp. EI5c]|uniref:DUF4350 domain-containing protein n=1 Tax=Frankia sp. EI5c TaxID=683316 RepID=UPI0007C32C63|nr:DUF4350 domain-containing protein [Frankia sp. EI5c]OAA19732.1 protein of unknown function (DUF4350) [Frankia sp. EI5c]
MTAPGFSPPRPAGAPSGDGPGGGGPGGAASSTATTHVRSGPRSAAVRGALRLVAVLAAIVTLYAVVAAVVSRSHSEGYLNIDSAGESGTRALAEILRDRGVSVSARESVTPNPGGPGRPRDPGTGGPRTILVTAPDLLSPTELDELVRRAGAGSDVVLVAPSPTALAALAMPVTTARPQDFQDAGGGDIEPACALAEATVAGPTTIGDWFGFTRSKDSDGPSSPGQGRWPGNGVRLDLCYGTPEAARLAVLAPAGQAATDPAGRLVLLGDGRFLTNDELDEAGNAALALGLLARHDRLEWVTPVVARADAVGGKSLSELLPSGFQVGLLQAFVALVALALWQGRRLGPPITEPLPVVVRSAETVEGRGRLYAAGHARERAAGALRAGLRTRLADRLGIRAGMPGTHGAAHEPEPAVLVAAVAEQTGRPPMEIGSLLYGSDMAPTGQHSAPWPGQWHMAAGWVPQVPHGPGRDADSDMALVRLARELHELDRQVGRR